MALTDRQRKAVPLVVASATVADAARRAKVARQTLHGWLAEDEFRAEVDRQREQVARQAYGLLKQNMTRAVETLAGLLDAKDPRIRRLAARDILTHALRLREHDELEAAIADLEERLAGLEERKD